MVALHLILAQGEVGYALDYWGGGGESGRRHTGSFPGLPLWNYPHALCKVSAHRPTNLLSSPQNNGLSGEREPLEGGGVEPMTQSRLGEMALPLVSYSL